MQFINSRLTKIFLKLEELAYSFHSFILLRDEKGKNSKKQKQTFQVVFYSNISDD
jgi:hypothetical protein